MEHSQPVIANEQYSNKNNMLQYISCPHQQIYCQYKEPCFLYVCAFNNEDIQANGGQLRIINMAMELQRIIGEYKAYFHLDKHQITIELRHKTEDHMLKTVLQNGALPASFANIFDDVSDIYSFAQGRIEENAAVVGNTLVLRVMILKKRKDISIEMARLEAEGGRKMADRLDRLERKTDRLAIDVNNMFSTFKNEIIKSTANHFNEEIKKLQGRITKLEKHIQKKQTSSSKPQNPPQQAPRIALIPQKIARISAPTHITRTYQFLVDPRSHYLEQYTIDRNSITRKVEDQEIYMLSGSEPIKKQVDTLIKMRINKITEGLIWIGLLCQSKKGEQYIGEEQGIIQLCLQGNRALIDGKIVNLSFKEFKDGQTIQMRTHLEDRQLAFYRNDADSPFYELEIPASMLSQPIYPYIQMITQGDSVSFLDD